MSSPNAIAGIASFATVKTAVIEYRNTYPDSTSHDIRAAFHLVEDRVMDDVLRELGITKGRRSIVGNDQDGLDYSKWCTFMNDEIVFMSNNVLGQILDDLKQEYADRVTQVLETTNDSK